MPIAEYKNSNYISYLNSDAHNDYLLYNLDVWSSHCCFPISQVFSRALMKKYFRITNKSCLWYKNNKRSKLDTVKCSIEIRRLYICYVNIIGWKVVSYCQYIILCICTCEVVKAKIMAQDFLYYAYDLHQRNDDLQYFSSHHHI